VTATPALLEVQVPVGTTEVELWFERRELAEITTWDSRYGQNYTFDVSSEGLPIPARSVDTRPESLVDLNKVRVVEDTATKERASRGKSLRTLLAVHALTGEPATAADAWADVHVFDATGQLIHAGSVAFKPPQRTADPALRVWEDDVYQGSGGGSGIGGMVSPGRPHRPVPAVLPGPRAALHRRRFASVRGAGRRGRAARPGGLMTHRSARGPLRSRSPNLTVIQLVWCCLACSHFVPLRAEWLAIVMTDLRTRRPGRPRLVV
jgi:Family of unknown function (DUF6209)